ncbi:MAG: hypothetical protein KME15_13500 [Drouetiella hepatica Uher 2000/2452]|jgi:hypothetical protein|uniref:Transmembrane protein n=1 Tax=Drouetiella hepatica Uher 2000/2452 TaxID=904376 RepID=A0A951QD50_9CYAN|nr:hypothetical protein [Drouetiella hepatica Uher 2000/2452]
MSHQAVRQHHNDPRRHRHSSSKVRHSAVEPTRQKSAEPNERLTRGHKGSQLVQFLRRYPLALLLAVWVVLMLLAGVAILDMTSLGAAKPPVSSGADAIAPIAPSPDLSAQSSEAPLSQGSPTAPETSPQPGRPSLQLLSLVTIALSCAIGCMIILQGLKPRRPPERSHSSVFSKSPLSKSVPSKSAFSNASHKSRASVTRANSRFQYVAPAHSASASTVPSAVSSVVPSRISQPLDWEEPSIADNLDLRQHRPLSDWL